MVVRLGQPAHPKLFRPQGPPVWRGEWKPCDRCGQTGVARLVGPAADELVACGHCNGRGWCADFRLEEGLANDEPAGS